MKKRGRKKGADGKQLWKRRRGKKGKRKEIKKRNKEKEMQAAPAAEAASLKVARNGLPTAT